MRKTLDLASIQSRLAVDCESGRAYWISPPKQRQHLVGMEAGCVTRGRKLKDYWVIRIGGVGYKRSHIVFAVATGAWPDTVIDHRDGDSLNDRASNLRACTQQQNVWNRKGSTKASKLPMGVRNTASGRFQSRLAVNGKSLCLGTFNDAAAAERAYLAARQQHYGEFA